MVIYYHGIISEDVKKFEKQMEYLSNHYNVVKLSQIKTTPPEKGNHVVAITFDDAFVNIMENALPVLKKFKLPAAVFVPTGNIGDIPRWEIPEECPEKSVLIMNEEQIRKIEQENIDIYSHTVSHPPLTEIDENELKTELEKSRQMLERIVGHDVDATSYPYGLYNSKVSQAAKEAGYKLGFTIEPRLFEDSTDSLEIGRFNVNPAHSMLEFKLKVMGAYHVCMCLKRAKAVLFPNR